MAKDLSKMKPKAIRKELAEVYGHPKGFLKVQTEERLVKMLNVERGVTTLVDEARATLVEEFGYDAETVRQQTSDEILRQHHLEQTAKAVKSKGKKVAEPEPETPPTAKPKRKSRAKKAESVADKDLGVDAVDLDAEIAELVDNQPAPVPSIFLGLPGVNDYIMDGHSGVGPSGAERWMSCTASLQASREFLETLTENQRREFAKANIAARQGTVAHNAAESKALLRLGRITDNEHEHTLLELANIPDTAAEQYDDEMSDFIEEYIDLVMQFAQERGRNKVLIEHRVTAPVALVGDHDGEVYEIPGSADCVALPTEEHPDLVVSDLKYGNGLEVEVEENKQERIYALGVLAGLADEEGNLPDGLENITYFVAQPRIGGISTWTESVADLLEWVDTELAPSLTAALYGPEAGAQFVPSDDACQWCPARGACPALAKMRTEAATELFEVIEQHQVDMADGEFPETGALPNDTLGALLSQIEGLTDLAKDLKAETQRRLHRGEEIPGYHLVSYTPKRVWNEDAEEALADLDVVWQRKMLTPTQALKVVAGDEETLASVAPHVIAPDKRPIAARVTDSRAKWEGKPPELMFTKVED